MSCSKEMLLLDRVQETLDYEADVKDPEHPKSVERTNRLDLMILHSNIHYLM